ncbi:hypothetical protein B0J11DRAFT_590544 [Dendryphion nanum]|uniref:Uncharacterized protein n=1 Tax=Dendryphion nanum TaxID=256645 RepID=A0A9P9IGC2_9PLEO|nr:hypothetical protein B0J11DRAFT_590544 [Dendryphion nanum]
MSATVASPSSNLPREFPTYREDVQVASPLQEQSPDTGAQADCHHPSEQLQHHEKLEESHNLEPMNPYALRTNINNGALNDNQLHYDDTHTHQSEAQLHRNDIADRQGDLYEHQADIPLQSHEQEIPTNSYHIQRQHPYSASPSPSYHPSPVQMKAKKKPGPKTTKPAPSLKDDVVAKNKVIREIERHWGKGFIKTYIPKCHRPLVKRQQGYSRAIPRRDECNPHKWHPSVLKSMLMLAKKTDDKGLLRKHMASVVKHRIRNTGNKKPQLVTTDFDVIEDIMERNWTLHDSFNVRYKHLLMNRPENAPPVNEKAMSEYFKHLFGMEDDDENDDGDQDDEDNDGMDIGDCEEEEDLFEISNDYQASSGHPRAPQPKQSKGSLKKKPQQSQHYGYDRSGPQKGYGNTNGYQDGYDSRYGNKYQNDYGHGYPTSNGYNNQHGNEGYHGGYNHGNGYGPSQNSNQRAHPQNAYGTGNSMAPPPARYRGDIFTDVHNSQQENSRPVNRSARYSHTPNQAPAPARFECRSRHESSTPEVPLAILRPAATPKNNSLQPMIKREMVEYEEFPHIHAPVAGPAHGRGQKLQHNPALFPDAGAHFVDASEMEEGDDEEEFLRAQIELEEANARRAQLKMQLLNSRRSKRSGGMGNTAANPMSLDD